MTTVDLNVPEYKIEEEDKEIVISIVAPLSKPKEAALVLEKDVFTFESSPYLLKIKLPHPVSDQCNDQAYDSSTGTYKIRLKKVSEKSEEDLEDNSEDILDGAVHSSVPQQSSKCKCFYGFANRSSNMFGKLYDEFSDVINLPNPDNTDVKDRRKLRLQEEDEKWSDDHYLADTMETEHLEPIFRYTPPWESAPVKDNLTDDEKQMLEKLIIKAIKNEELSEAERKQCEFQLVDILFAYAYNKRTTEGDNTVESGWTINKLSSTLSWFEEFEDLKTVLLSCYRRSLIYPFYRNWNLVQTLHKDVADILKSGPKQVARCLLEVIEIFNDSDNRYLLNTLYVNGLCNYANNMTSEQLQELSAEVQKVKITKHEVNLDLPLLEIAAHLTLEEETVKGESKVSKIVGKITKLNLGTGNVSSSDSDESDSDE